MTLLEKLIEERLLQDIVDLIRPIEERELENDPEYLRHHLLPVLSFEIYKKEFRNHIYKITSEYYKRNLTILELILEKQNNSDNLRLALKIVRENLGLENISSEITLYNLYHIYTNKELYTYNPKKFVLHEPQEFYKIESYLRSLNQRLKISEE